MKISSELLEHVAGRMIDKVSKNFLRLHQIKIKIHQKAKPPMQRGEVMEGCKYCVEVGKISLNF